MESNKQPDARTKDYNDSKDSSNIRLSEVIDTLAQRNPLWKAKHEFIKQLRFLADALENDQFDKLKGILEQHARTDIASDVFEHWWIAYGGCDYDEHKEKYRMAELMRMARELSK